MAGVDEEEEEDKLIAACYLWLYFEVVQSSRSIDEEAIGGCLLKKICG